MDYEDRHWISAFNLNLGISSLLDFLSNWFHQIDSAHSLRVNYAGFGHIPTVTSAQPFPPVRSCDLSLGLTTSNFTSTSQYGDTTPIGAVTVAVGALEEDATAASVGGCGGGGGGGGTSTSGTVYVIGPGAVTHIADASLYRPNKKQYPVCRPGWLPEVSNVQLTSVWSILEALCAQIAVWQHRRLYDMNSGNPSSSDGSSTVNDPDALGGTTLLPSTMLQPFRPFRSVSDAAQHWLTTAVQLHGTATRHLPQQLSFHIPLHRALAHCIMECCKYPHLVSTLTALQMHYFTLSREAIVRSDGGKRFAPEGAIISGMASSGEHPSWTNWYELPNELMSQLRFLIDVPLQVVVFAAQVRIGLWRRNGTVMNDQLLNYAEYPFARIYSDLDLTLLQFCLSLYASQTYQLECPQPQHHVNEQQKEQQQGQHQYGETEAVEEAAGQADMPTEPPARTISVSDVISQIMFRFGVLGCLLSEDDMSVARTTDRRHHEKEAWAAAAVDRSNGREDESEDDAVGSVDDASTDANPSSSAAASQRSTFSGRIFRLLRRPVLVDSRPPASTSENAGAIATGGGSGGGGDSAMASTGSARTNQRTRRPAAPEANSERARRRIAPAALPSTSAFGYSPADGEVQPSPALNATLLEEFFKFMINIVTELPSPPAADQRTRLLPLLRRELVHRLVTSSATHSQLHELLVYFHDLGAKMPVDDIDHLLASMTERHDPPVGMGPPTYSLRKELWAEYDPCFPRMKHSAHQTAFETRPKIPGTQHEPMVQKPLAVHPCFEHVRWQVLLSPLLLRAVRTALLIVAAGRMSSPSSSSSSAMCLTSTEAKALRLQRRYSEVTEQWKLISATERLYMQAVQLLTLMLHETLRLHEARSGSGGGDSGGYQTRVYTPHDTTLDAADILVTFLLEEVPVSSAASRDDSSEELHAADASGTATLPSLMQCIADLYVASQQDSIEHNISCWLGWIVSKAASLSPDCASICSKTADLTPESFAVETSKVGPATSLGGGAASATGSVQAADSAVDGARVERDRETLKQQTRDRAMASVQASAQAFLAMMEDLSDSEEEGDDEEEQDKKDGSAAAAAGAGSAEALDTANARGDEEDVFLSIDEEPVCIICMQEGGDGGAATASGSAAKEAKTAAAYRESQNTMMGYLALGQASTLLHKAAGDDDGVGICDSQALRVNVITDEHPVGDNLSAPRHCWRDRTACLHLSFCGHAMHRSCYETYLKAAASRSAQQQHIVLDAAVAAVSYQPPRVEGQSARLRPQRQQYTCPLCKKLGNCFVPHTGGVTPSAVDAGARTMKTVSTRVAVSKTGDSNGSSLDVMASQQGKSPRHPWNSHWLNWIEQPSLFADVPGRSTDSVVTAVIARGSGAIDMDADSDADSQPSKRRRSHTATAESSGGDGDGDGASGEDQIMVGSESGRNSLNGDGSADNGDDMEGVSFYDARGDLGTDHHENTAARGDVEDQGDEEEDGSDVDDSDDVPNLLSNSGSTPNLLPLPNNAHSAIDIDDDGDDDGDGDDESPPSIVSSSGSDIAFGSNGQEDSSGRSLPPLLGSSSSDDDAPANNGSNRGANHGANSFPHSRVGTLTSASSSRTSATRQRESSKQRESRQLPSVLVERYKWKTYDH